MTPDADERLRVFLRDTLALWQIEGSVDAAEPPAVAVVRSADGCVVRIERAPATSPFRWVAHLEAASSVLREAHARPCASWVGVLNALRRALGVERGSPIRIARDDA